MQLQGAAKLQEELLATETQLAQLRRCRRTIRRSRALHQPRGAAARGDRRAGRAGRGSERLSFTAQSSGYDRLVLEKTFAERQLAPRSPRSRRRKTEAQRQQLYLETLVQPNLPDKAIEPRRLRTVVMVSCWVWSSGAC